MWPQWPSSSADTKAEGRLNANCFSSRQLVLIQDSVIFAVLVWVPCHDSSVIPKKVSARWLLGAWNKTLTINYSDSHLPGPQPSVAPPALGLMSRSGAFSAEPAVEGVRSVPVSPDPPAARLTKISASVWSRGRTRQRLRSRLRMFGGRREQIDFFSVMCHVQSCETLTQGHRKTSQRNNSAEKEIKTVLEQKIKFVPWNHAQNRKCILYVLKKVIGRN